MRKSLLLSLVLSAILCTAVSCKKGDDGTPPDGPPVVQPRDKVKDFIQNQVAISNQFVFALEFVCEPIAGSKDTNDARLQWRLARHEYEKIRFGMTQFLWSLHEAVCLWHSAAPLYRGFHYLERAIFRPLPALAGKELDIEVVHAFLVNLPAQLKSIVVTDDGVFRGLQRTLSDIDSIRFSRLDKAYADNAYADIQSNYDGMDSVYSYYRTTIVKADSMADVNFLAAIGAARSKLLAAGTLDALDIPGYRTKELADLNSALKGVAAALKITLP
jgi:iron uptake system EfeUOB component EfeO/EfeM